MRQDVHSILVMQAGALGDTVLQLRLAQALKRAWPHAAVTWLGRDGWLPLARGCPSVDTAVGADAMRIHRLFEPQGSTPQDLRGFLEPFDLLVNGMTPEDAPLTARLREFKGESVICYNTKPRAGLARHVCRQWIDQLAAGLPRTAIVQALASLDEPDALFVATPADLETAADYLQRAGLDANDLPPRLVLLHPGSGGRHKCWPLEHYLELGRLLGDRGWQPAMVLGPAELERLGFEAQALVQRSGVLVEPSLSAILGLAHLCAAYVGNDAGPTHLLAAAGVPTLAIFGPTDPAVWAPLGPAVRILRSSAPAAGWTDLAPGRVLDALVTTALAPRG